MAEKVAWSLNFLGVDCDLLELADTDAFLELINEYLEEPEGILPPVNPTL